MILQHKETKKNETIAPHLRSGHSLALQDGDRR